MIPAQAVEAAARKLCALAGYDWDNIDAPDDVAADFKAQITAQAKSVLEAAAPHLLGREREQARLAHVDAMVNRETKRGELAGAWDEGMHAMYDSTSSEWPTIPEANPYRPTV